MHWRQVLMPAGLLVIPALALGWLALRGDDHPPPRRPVTSDTTALVDEAMPDDAPDDERPPSRRPPPRPATRRPSRSADHSPAPRVDERGAEGGGNGDPLDPETGDVDEHPNHEEAVALLEEGDWAAALEKANACLEESPTNRACFDDKVRALLGSGDMEAARGVVANCAETRSDDLALCTGSRVLLALQEGDLVGAEEVLATLEEQAPTSQYTVMARAEIFAEQGDAKPARVNYLLACVRGHKLACKKVPGVKKAGGP